MAYVKRQTTAEGTLVTPDEARQRRAASEAKANGHLRCFTCRQSFDPSRSAIKGRKVAPSMNCNACLNAGYEQGRWQELFLHEAAGETAERKAA